MLLANLRLASLLLTQDGSSYPWARRPRRHPKAAKSLSEGLDETLTVHRLRIAPLLRETLSSTNAMESANSVCAGILRRVTNFGNGKITLHHAAAGFLEAERSFRRVNGYRDIAHLKANLAVLTESGDWSKIGIA